MNRIVTAKGDETAEIWERRRPEYAMGVLALSEFWATLIFGIALAWSLRRDWKRFGAMKKKVEGEAGYAQKALPSRPWNINGCGRKNNRNPN